ncbi:MAG TPA: hypothetical protein VFV87_10330 [Pirellulaceae bacterium]|nr:hypothetical protein [Pirellulaceae bacterium]
MFAQRGFQAAVCVQLIVWGTCAVQAEVPRLAPPVKDTLQEVLDRIHHHAASDEWQKEGWKDTAIEAWLDKLIAAIAKGTDRPGFQLPVRLADVKPAELRFRKNGLLIGKDVKALGLENSVVLADGDIEATLPRNCVLVARGVVSISGARNCVIVSGCCVTGTHDGEPRGADGGSLLVSRGWIDLETAYGSTIVAGLGMSIGRSQEARFVNAEVPPMQAGFDWHRGSKSVKILDLPLESALLHLMSEKIRLVGVIQGPSGNDPLTRRRSAAASGVVFRLDDRRYVADLNEAIVDEVGLPVEALRGWTLSHATDRIAIFRNGDQEILVRGQAN